MTKIFIQTYGCSMNFSDSETMAGLLKQEGHTLTKNKEEADLVIFNTCTVKNPTQSKFFDELEKTKKEKKVLVAGCIAQAQPHLFKQETLLGVEQLIKVNEAVTAAEKGSNVMFLQRNKEEKRIELPSIRRNKLIEIIPINKGCTGKCTYCKTKAARGVLSSFPLREIVSRANKAVSEGAKEIWLTSQDTGAYGLDIRSSMPELVKKVADNNGEFMIRIGMTNPEFVLQYEKELLQLFAHPKTFKFLHVPIQAGSQKVLDNMIRPYNIQEIKECLLRMKKANPELTLATDIICGFPGETESEWQETMNIMKEIDFPIVNISKFYKRPGTKAFKMKQLSSTVIKNRSREITNWLIAKNDRVLENKIVKVFANEHKNGQTHAKTNNYRQIVINEELPLGKWYTFQITEVHTFYFSGKIIKTPNNE